MVPRADVPRSTFHTMHTHKTTFHSGYLVPIYVDEVLPGDVHKGDVTVFGRLATPLFPIMDNMKLETFFFFVPSRLVWDNWKKMMGEQANPGDSIAYTVPQCVSPSNGFAVCSIGDYFGLPTVGMLVSAGTVSVNAMPLRAYNLIWNEWFRDENLNNSVVVSKGDGPDASTQYALLRRNKRHDYFTSCLPWPLKGGTTISLPLGGFAAVNPIIPGVSTFQLQGGNHPPMTPRADATTVGQTLVNAMWLEGSGDNEPNTSLHWLTSGLQADLSTATGATINAMRLAVATQQLLEKDARGGTRYTELLKQHFGVTPEDARLQRPEYIGGGQTDIQTSAVPQTSAQIAAGTPLGTLGAAGIMNGQHRFSYHATEHGYIIGLIHCGADLTYQQGLHKMWTRKTRYDFYWPTFAHLGEQVVKQGELYVIGDANDDNVFGYQERWAEYRHRPGRITGMFKSPSAGAIDQWHLAQRFLAAPLLNPTFIQDNPPVDRVIAAGQTADNMQILFDSVFKIASTRPLPTFSVPGLDRF